MNYPLIISFATPDWTYSEHAVRLRAECDALGLDHHIADLPSRGGYLENCCMKPQFLLDCLRKFKRPVVWIDVDGTIKQRPDFFLEPGFDFQARRMPPSRPRTWHVGTMYWAPTRAALAFIRQWIARTGDMSDESSLEQTWQEHGSKLRTRDIPSTYFEIPTRSRRLTPECVIFHRLSDGQSKRDQARRFNDYEAAEAAHARIARHPR